MRMKSTWKDISSHLDYALSERGRKLLKFHIFIATFALMKIVDVTMNNGQMSCKGSRILHVNDDWTATFWSVKKYLIISCEDVQRDSNEVKRMWT